MLRRLLASASTALVVTGLAGCGNTDSWVDSTAAHGWAAQYGDAANSSYTATGGASTLRLQWSRSVKGELGAGAALGDGAYLAVNGQTAAGCSLMVWENDNNGRQRWCTRMVLGGGFASPLFDQFDNLYVGQPGMMQSYPPTQWIRWRQNVIGMPTTARFLGGGQLLVVTHLGQVLVFDSHRGEVSGTPLDLVEGLDPTDSTRGLADCARGLPQCPVAAPPAYAAATHMIVVSVWQPGAEASTLIGLRYHPGQTPLLTREWTSDVVAAGVLAAPVSSADGSTVYITGRDRKLWALNTSDGKLKWSVPLDFQPQTPPSVSPDGLIVCGGGPNTHLVAVKDAGSHADVTWRRDDITPLSTSSQAGGVAYTVVADPQSGLSLLVFGPADGHTLDNYPLPEADGFPVGISVGLHRRVVVATSAGQVYSFEPAD
ncbi:PQQ-binding-like beta-propeller repeat protein [Mycobacterium sp. CVI_P3]|uniref:PQQ-binding-like beta-propeller repeat protein n=1 Tax=Mycobacterium pinniadriaticum TaxID=2994102 RepID=A0ABT3SLH5_9MYCO|nr:PQQ-binding-like beta-propeller repeat protein [Mycobacterium pinniadriaticum]MCX2933945.1 PQQ-binding-like beta-propeller repeat protein [Mycobacterium pinniadriaticum]MCX2940367.1 PQQ-binding-like beta-propeller repeat protein [Mycobacterium pinniadriaticum]